MAKIVAVVICGILALPAANVAASRKPSLLEKASALSGLPIRRPVTEKLLGPAQYDAALLRASNREYPRSLRGADTALYVRLGLMPASLPAQLVASSDARAWYDPVARKLLLRRRSMQQRAHLLNELVRALVDQNFDLRRIAPLRGRDRDRSLAAKAIVNGTAALASGVATKPPGGTPHDRFLQQDSGLDAGKALAKQLRYLGGSHALASALRVFPRTTEQLLHVDKFLEREPALDVGLPTRVGDQRLSTSETFGELDVRSLLRTFGVPDSDTAAAGWGGGRIGLYVSPAGETTAVLALKWDTIDDAAEWRDAIARYIAVAFPGVAQHDCPPLDHCWSGASSVASAVLGTSSVFASGPAAGVVGAAVLAQK
jgi:hypothetical protein